MTTYREIISTVIPTVRLHPYRDYRAESGRTRDAIATAAIKRADALAWLARNRKPKP